jgi:hypothetical protein
MNLRGLRMETVKIYRDGNQICAIIGDMPTENAVGFGPSAALALQALSSELSKIGTLVWTLTLNSSERGKAKKKGWWKFGNDNFIDFDSDEYYRRSHRTSFFLVRLTTLLMSLLLGEFTRGFIDFLGLIIPFRGELVRGFLDFFGLTLPFR